jgi:tetratricopeptide (TPR) repeat protein
MSHGAKSWLASPRPCVDNPQQLFERGRRAAEQGDLRSALAAVSTLLEDHAQHPQGACLQGIVARLRGDREGAEAALAQALVIDPADAQSHLELAALHLKSHDHESALDHAAQALAAQPDSARAFLVMGRAYDKREELEEAIGCLKRALALDPALTECYEALGWIYIKQKKHREAMQVCERALETDPENVDVQNLLGFCFVRAEEYAKGVELFTKVCERTPPSFIAGRVNLANAYFHTGSFEGALRVYEQILAQEPNNFEARWNKSHLQLAEHRFEEGWRNYEFRAFINALWGPRLFPYRPWRGEPLEGASLLVISEQGLGDEIMFASCIPDAMQRAKRVIIECNERLERLLRRSFPQAEIHPKAVKKSARSLAWLKQAGRIDYQVYMGSMPGLLRNRWEEFPQHRGYLRADPQRVAHWKARLDALGPGRKIGLSWRGGTAATRRNMRSISLERLLPLMQTPGCKFVSLQYGDCAGEIAQFSAASGMALPHWQEAIDDYDETAALVEALDLTVSVCTSIIHLGGALGRPVWVMVPAVPEYRYGRRGERMPWYPSVRLFRSPRIDDWDPVISALAAELKSF